MKQLCIAMFTVAVLFAYAGTAAAQGNARGTAKLSLHGKAISVEYGRPALKGRKVEDLLGQLGTGEVWRLGADKSTTFTTAADLDFGGVKVAKGEYSLWARKEANGWALVFNSQHGQWGTDHDASKDVASVPLKEEKEGNAEQATIKLEEEHGGGEISIQWGDMELSANFK